MCGTLLEARPEARRPAGAPVAGLPKKPNAPEPPGPLVVESATKPASPQGPSINEASILGWHQPGANQSIPYQPSPHQPSPHQAGPDHPNMDLLREKAFSGLDSFFEPEQPKTGGLRVLLLVVLLVALGGAGWWTFTNFIDATESRKPEAVTSSADEAPAEKPSTKSAANDAPPASDAGSSQAVAPSTTPESQPQSASADPDSTRKTVDAEAKPVTPAEPTTAAPAVPKAVPPDKSPVKPEPGAIPAKASTPAQPAAADTGDAAFRKGEAYLYGRGERENCEEAVKYLKAASAKSNAKARSAFGTMYATGHCVPRDLPTSYLWFALALRVDPNNQILEKDLSAVWNQMTPPERQMATRMKQ